MIFGCLAIWLNRYVCEQFGVYAALTNLIFTLNILIILLLKVNRIRELPQNSSILATHTDSPEVHLPAIFEYFDLIASTN